MIDNSQGARVCHRLRRALALPIYTIALVLDSPARRSAASPHGSPVTTDGPDGPLPELEPASH
jgi:hypothetical protein